MKNLKRNYNLIFTLGFFILSIVSWYYDDDTCLIVNVVGFYGSLILYGIERAVEELKKK